MASGYRRGMVLRSWRWPQGQSPHAGLSRPEYRSGISAGNLAYTHGLGIHLYCDTSGGNKCEGGFHELPPWVLMRLSKAVKRYRAGLGDRSAYWKCCFFDRFLNVDGSAHSYSGGKNAFSFLSTDAIKQSSITLFCDYLRYAAWRSSKITAKQCCHDGMRAGRYATRPEPRW